MLERLTEITFIELLRHEIMAAPPGSTGWLAALAEPALGRCLSLIHDEPEKSWTVEALGTRLRTFEEHPDRALRHRPQDLADQLSPRLASLSGECELVSSTKSITKIADDAGYGTESAFSRAFCEAYGTPPAAWRKALRKQASAP